MTPAEQPQSRVLDYQPPPERELSQFAYAARLTGGIAAGGAHVFVAAFLTAMSAIGSGVAAAMVTIVIFTVAAILLLMHATLRHREGHWRGVAVGLWIGFGLGLLGLGICGVAVI